ncbi:MAG: hypothetical protein ACR2HN_00705 [Tepidiformaceae bacterium]
MILRLKGTGVIGDDNDDVPMPFYVVAIQREDIPAGASRHWLVLDEDNAVLAETLYTSDSAIVPVRTRAPVSTLNPRPVLSEADKHRLAARAIELIARREGVGVADVNSVYVAAGFLPYTRVTTVGVKAQIAGSDRLVGIEVGLDGQEVDPEALARAEREAEARTTSRR